uniref:Uncharacterized protein n=1 Tax=Oncorhynchus tshawytscha TaxID=74940 RepID=A0AAZ3Q957_ONCTS
SKKNNSHPSTHITPKSENMSFILEEIDIDLEASETKVASLAIQNKFRHFQIKK